MLGDKVAQVRMPGKQQVCLIAQRRKFVAQVFVQ
jgi:hypothetical protein